MIQQEKGHVLLSMHHITVPCQYRFLLAGSEKRSRSPLQASQSEWESFSLKKISTPGDKFRTVRDGARADFAYEQALADLRHSR